MTLSEVSRGRQGNAAAAAGTTTGAPSLGGGGAGEGGSRDSLGYARTGAGASYFDHSAAAAGGP